MGIVVALFTNLFFFSSFLPLIIARPATSIGVSYHQPSTPHNSPTNPIPALFPRHVGGDDRKSGLPTRETAEGHQYQYGDDGISSISNIFWYSTTYHTYQPMPIYQENTRERKARKTNDNKEKSKLNTHTIPPRAVTVFLRSHRDPYLYRTINRDVALFRREMEHRPME